VHENQGNIDEEDLIKAIVDNLPNEMAEGRASLYGTCEGKSVEGVIKSHPHPRTWLGL
jgi:hypothetical protein